MYICVCRGISEEQLKEKLAKGHSTKEVLLSLGVGDDCGVCLISAIDKLKGITNQKNIPTEIKKIKV